MTLTERELQMKYLLLEDSYRKLEERVAKLEVDLALREMLGMNEKLKNTSISLFLLRKDRERLASDLGLDVSDYVSTKSLGESALESLIYENKDVLNELSESLELSEETDNEKFNSEKLVIEKPVLEVSEVISEIEKSEINENLESSQEIINNNELEKENSVSSTTFIPKSLNTENDEVSSSVKKPVTKRGRKSKAEKEAEEKQKIEAEEKLKLEAEKNIQLEAEPKLGEDFEDLDAALNMWN